MEVAIYVCVDSRFFLNYGLSSCERRRRRLRRLARLLARFARLLARSARLRTRPGRLAACRWPGTFAFGFTYAYGAIPSGGNPGGKLPYRYGFGPYKLPRGPRTLPAPPPSKACRTPGKRPPIHGAACRLIELKINSLSNRVTLFVHNSIHGRKMAQF